MKDGKILNYRQKTKNPSDGPVENWTKFPNSILESLTDLHPIETHIYCAMIWQTLGQQNPDARMSLRFLEKRTGLAQKTVIKYLQSLCNRGTIEKTFAGDKSNPAEYKIRWIYRPDSLLEAARNRRKNEPENVNQETEW